MIDPGCRFSVGDIVKIKSQPPRLGEVVEIRGFNRYEVVVVYYEDGEEMAASFDDGALLEHASPLEMLAFQARA